MNEDALRALVRETIARVSAGTDPLPPAAAGMPNMTSAARHPSSYQYVLPPSDGPCLIEPGVQCNHCGFCQTHGY
jgi:hypothetical protein